jgi:hypothetical protein
MVMLTKLDDQFRSLAQNLCKRYDGYRIALVIDDEERLTRKA